MGPMPRGTSRAYGVLSATVYYSIAPRLCVWTGRGKH
jgi:hypothetical protein